MSIIVKSNGWFHPPHGEAFKQMKQNKHCGEKEDELMQENNRSGFLGIADGFEKGARHNHNSVQNKSGIQQFEIDKTCCNYF
jgi:hypothetical protein